MVRGIGVALVAGLGAFFGGSTGWAADLPMRAAPPIAVERAPYNWTGFYIGANVGGNITSNYNADAQDGSGFSFHDDNSGLAAATLDTGTGGIAGGVQAGYNWQYGPMVLGGEADITALSAGGGSSWTSTATLLGSTLTTYANEKLDYLGTVRLRLGYSPWDRWLFYVTGGLAYGEVENNGSITMNGAPAYVWSNSNSSLRTGYTFGGGVAWAWTEHISLRAEAYYYSLGAHLNTDVGNAAVQGNPALNSYNLIYKTTNVGDLLRVGVDYKF